MRTFALFLLAACRLAIAPLAAQQASPYVPLQHWAMPYVEHLISAGIIADPTPLTRPLKQADLVRALDAVDTLAGSSSVRGTVRTLLAEFTPRVQGPHYKIEVSGGARAATYALRDPLEIGRGIPVRKEDRRAFVNGTLDLQLLFGPVVAVSHPTVDTRLTFDPDWYGRSDNATRYLESYLSAQWTHGEVFLGNLDRNWGPSGIQGILLSDSPYSLDNLYVSVGTPGVQVQGIATQLDTRTDPTGALVNRYMVHHRLYIRPRGRWTLALWNSLVSSGVGRQLEPWYLNIANLSLVVSSNTSTNVNSFLGLDFERHGKMTAFGQFMLDDIQVSRKIPSDLKPTSYAFTLGAKGRVGAWPAAWTAFYTQVSNLAYRNEDDLQVPLYHFLGTGRNFDDYDQATAKLSLIARSGLLLEPELTLVRQGEGDPRLPHPLVSAYPSTATLFQGVVQRTLRAAVSGSLTLDRNFGMRFDAGVHHTSNDGHVTGATRTRFVGSVGVEYRLRYADRIP